MSNHIRMSFSWLIRYLGCPRQDFYERHPDVSRRTDYPRLCGQEVHRHVNYLHHPLGASSEPRPFFYKTKLAAIKQWFWRWQQALEDNAEKLVRQDLDNADKFGKIGAKCVITYWDKFFGWPHPLEREASYEHPIITGVSLMGRLDQVRTVSIPWIKAHRPELVENDRLVDGYAPVVIVDFKTGYQSFDAFAHMGHPTLDEQVAWQLPLHLNYQPTAYTWLYHQVRRVQPVGFIWYHLPSGRGFFTYRTSKDYDELYTAVRHVVDGLSANSFPRNPGNHCRRCDHFAPCWGERPLLVASAEYFPQGSEVPDLKVVSNFVKRVGQQVSLKLGVPRRKKGLPSLPPKGPKLETIMIGGAPPTEIQDTPQLELVDGSGKNIPSTRER